MPEPALGADGWTETTLGALAPFRYGRALTAKDRVATGTVPVYGSSGIVGQHDVALHDGPGIIVGRKGNVGSVFWSAGPFWPIDTTFVVTDPGPADLRFVYHLLLSLSPLMALMNEDSAVPGLNRTRAHAIKVSVPGPAEQARLAERLGRIDAMIDHHRASVEALDGFRRLLFRQIGSGRVVLDARAARTAVPPASP